MKKIFTLVSLAVVALTANAQKITWSVADLSGEAPALKSIIVNNEDPTQASVFEATEGPVTIKGVSGPVAGFKDYDTPDETDVPAALEPNYDNTWSGLNTQADCANGPFYYVKGKGNPVDLTKVTIEAVTNEGSFNGKFRANWDNSYYVIDGSNGLCSNGTYMTLTSTEAGKMTAVVWVAKGNRDVYIVPASTKVALTPEQVIVEGYVNAENNSEGKKNYFSAKKEGDISFLSYDIIDNNGVTNYVVRHHKLDPDVLNEDGSIKEQGRLANSQPFFLYLSWDAAAGETYYIFNKNTQIGIGGFEFEGSSAINNISVAPVKAVAKAIQNGRVVIVKGGNTFNVAGQLVK